MKTKIYSLLYFQQLNDKYSKWIFPLHEGENIIGSDKDVDIFLYLNKQEDIIESVHCKIIVDENQSNIGIISLTDKGFVKKVDTSKEEKIILSPGKVYELKNKSIFLSYFSFFLQLLSKIILKKINYLSLQASKIQIQNKKKLRAGELNSGHLRDRQVY